jgi:hypothetical protein
MPAIASLEDLKAAQKEGLLFYEGLPQVKRSSSVALLERSDPMASLAPEQLKGEEG